MEIKKEVKVFRVTKQCPFCMAENMVATGEAFLSNPPQYIHKCNECEHTMKITGGIKYPYIEYKEIE